MTILSNASWGRCGQSRRISKFVKKLFKTGASYTLVNNCFNHVKGLEKLGHMVLHAGDAVYIAGEYNLCFHSHKSTLGSERCCSAFDVVSSKAFLLITLLQNGQRQVFPAVEMFLQILN